MGFITTINHNGREVYACECGGKGCTRYPAKAHHCPHKWCQRWYFCANCWQTIKPRWCKQHESCKQSSDASKVRDTRRATLFDEGHFVRRSALGHETDSGYMVKVFFNSKDGKKVCYWMSKATYDTIPLLAPASLQDYQTQGAVHVASSHDLYINDFSVSSEEARS